ncbi:MAG: hypothetical protein JJU02_14810 [Cryomorphaceae bacterium]|nr:hypothetical protein [Cryomorphaceae bacterium]
MKKYHQHLGEYIREKFKEKGIKQTTISEKMGMSRQNFASSILDKNDLLASQIIKLKEILGDEFFDEFYFQNPSMRIDNVGEERSDYGMEAEKFKKLPGFRISIEIDPENFNPEDSALIGEAIAAMVAKIKEK